LPQTTAEREKMEKPIETIEVSDQLRYAIRYDDWPLDYLKDYDHEFFSVFTIRKGDRLYPLELDNFGLNRRLRNALDWTKRDDTEAVLGKILTRAGYTYKFVELQDYPSAWHDLVIYWSDEEINPEGYIDELSAWYKGHVYRVALEQKETYVGRNNTIERWEVIDEICQVIFTKNYQFTLDTCKELLGEPALAN
jgi:hypothetical protein